MFSGANERIRTADLRITSALLYQLSHVGAWLQNEANTQYTETPYALQEGGAKFISAGRSGVPAFQSRQRPHTSHEVTSLR